MENTVKSLKLESYFGFFCALIFSVLFLWLKRKDKIYENGKGLFSQWKD